MSHFSANKHVLSKLGPWVGLHSSGLVLFGRFLAMLFFFSLPRPLALHSLTSQAFLWYLYFPPRTDPEFSSTARAVCSVLPSHSLTCSHVTQKGRGQQLALLPGSGALRSHISHVLCCWWTDSCATVFGICLRGGGVLDVWHCATMYRELPRAESTECLGNMTPETQDIYLRMDHHRRRSGYRLGRIIARQQLLKRIAAGMTGWSNMALSVCFYCMSQPCLWVCVCIDIVSDNLKTFWRWRCIDVLVYIIVSSLKPFFLIFLAISQNYGL